MAKKKKAIRRSRRVVRKSVPRSSRRVRRSSAVKAPRKKRTVSSMFSAIRVKLDAELKEALFKRDKATTYKQHRSAQLRIDRIRQQLRKAS